MCAMLVMGMNNELWFERYNFSPHRREILLPFRSRQSIRLTPDTDVTLGEYYLHVILFGNSSELSPANFLMLFPFRLRGNVGFLLSHRQPNQTYQSYDWRSVKPVFSFSEEDRAVVNEVCATPDEYLRIILDDIETIERPVSRRDCILSPNF